MLWEDNCVTPLRILLLVYLSSVWTILAMFLPLCTGITSGRARNHMNAGDQNLVNHVWGKCPTHCNIAPAHSLSLLKSYGVSVVIKALLHILLNNQFSPPLFGNQTIPPKYGFRHKIGNSTQQTEMFCFKYWSHLFTLRNSLHSMPVIEKKHESSSVTIKGFLQIRNKPSEQLY